MSKRENIMGHWNNSNYLKLIKVTQSEQQPRL